jgi:hypothetical protein
MSETKVAKYGDALRCLMRGDSTGKFNDPRHQTVFQNMLAEKRQGLDPKNLKARSRSEVQICIAPDENGDDENFFYIPDILILMLEVHKTNNAFSPRNDFPALPLDLNYLERLRVTESVTEGFNDWLATEQGQSDWQGFVRTIEDTSRRAVASTTTTKPLPSYKGVDLVSPKQNNLPLSELSTPSRECNNLQIIAIKEPINRNPFYDEIFLPALRSFENKNRSTPNSQQLWAWIIENQVKGYSVTHVQSRKLLRVTGFNDMTQRAFNERYKRYFPPRNA